MKTLRSCISLQSSLEEFVEVANALMPQFLPDEKLNQRVREEVTPRLVRYYTSLGMLDEPLRSGKEARYTYRHLLQLLVVRRLLAAGHGAATIGDLARSRTDEQLEELLEGGVQVTFTAANPALAFLQKIRSNPPSPPAAPVPPRRQPPPVPLPVPAAPPVDSEVPDLSGALAGPPSHWVRLEVLPGLELHVRGDFVPPSSPHEQQNLAQVIAGLLAAYFSKTRRPTR